MNASDYFSWISRHTQGRAQPESADENEERAAPSAPIEVIEHDPASTTVIQKVRSAIARRFRSDP